MLSGKMGNGGEGGEGKKYFCTRAPKIRRYCRLPKTGRRRLFLKISYKRESLKGRPPPETGKYFETILSKLSAVESSFDSLSSKFGEYVLHQIKRDLLTNYGGTKSNKF